MALIELIDIEKRYATVGTTGAALHGANLSIGRGEFISIMGPSGSGKSTLLNLLGTLDRPTSGQYILDGKHTEHCTDTELSSLRGQLIGFVFQGFNLIGTRTLLENVALPLRYLGVSHDHSVKRAEQCLARVGLEKLGKRLPDQVSGGQQQRAAIARALVCQPQLLLADEPTGALDSKTGVEVMDLFRELHRESITIILVTHDASVAQAADRLVQIKDGTIVYDGPMY